MSAYTDKVRPHTLRSGLLALGSGGRSFEEGSHLKKIKKIKLNRAVINCRLVLGVGLALTRSYSERWQVARIRLCNRCAVCGALKI